MSEANFVAEVNPNIKPSDPSCHVCGAVMVLCTHQRLTWLGRKVEKFWKCCSCGTTTGCS